MKIKFIYPLRTAVLCFFSACLYLSSLAAFGDTMQPELLKPELLKPESQNLESKNLELKNLQLQEQALQKQEWQTFSKSDLDELARYLQTPIVLRGDFTQEKTIKGIKRPLKSNGQFVYQKNTGLLWQTTKPFASSMTITAKGISQLNSNNTMETITAQDNPGLNVFTNIFLSIASGDLASLPQHFEIKGKMLPNLHKEQANSLTTTRPTQSWILNLQPKDPKFAAIIESIVLSGHTVIENVLVQEKAGDQTKIHYSNTNPAAQPLTSDELRFFAAP